MHAVNLGKTYMLTEQYIPALTAAEEWEAFDLNIAFFVTPKAMISYLYEDYSVRQGLEKMRKHGFTAVPVISRSGRYIGTVTEGDFLWCMVDSGADMRKLEKLPVSGLIRAEYNPPVRITANIVQLVESSQNQNFVPVIDDNDNLVGIVKRSDIINYFKERHVTANGGAD